MTTPSLVWAIRAAGSLAGASTASRLPRSSCIMTCSAPCTGAGWLAESMRQNVAWDSSWTLLAEGFSHAQIQVRNGYVTRTPMFFVYQMAQEFYGLDYLTNSYSSAMGSTSDNLGNTVQFPWTTVRTFRDPANGNIHLFVVNQSTNSAATISGFEKLERPSVGSNSRPPATPAATRWASLDRSRSRRSRWASPPLARRWSSRPVRSTTSSCRLQVRPIPRTPRRRSFS